jgi:hypothetical protein
MTVTTTTNRIVYTGDASTTIFAYNFKIFTDSDLVVQLDGVTQTLTTHYTVSGAGNPGGGNVTFVTAPGNNVQVLILRTLPVTQATDYEENDPFPAQTHEDGLDRLTMIAQQFEEILDRSVTIPVTSTLANITIPDPALTANQGKLLRVNPSGTGIDVVDPGFSSDGVITTKGDIIQGGTTGAAERLAIGATGAIPKVVSGKLAYLAPGAEGALLRINAGIPEYLSPGAADQFLGITSGEPAWKVLTLRGYIDGLQTSEGTDALHDVNIGAGVAMNAAGTKILNFSALTGKQGDAAFAEGANAGGNMAGSSMTADTFYYGFLISKDADGTLDFMFDTSPTGANVDAGWTVERRLWGGYSDSSSNWLSWYQRGEYMLYKNPPLDINQITTPTSRTLHTLRVPKVSDIIAVVNIELSGTSELVNFMDPTRDDEGPTSTAAPGHLKISTGENALSVLIPTNSSGQIAVRSNGSGADVYLSIVGWIDRRGKDA